MAPSNQDLTPPFDPTGYPSITGAQLLQLITGSVPHTGDRGMVLFTTDSFAVPDVPDASITTKWQQYIWVRVLTNVSNVPTAVALYVWNPAVASDPTYKNWVNATAALIPAGSITNAMLAGGITYDKINSINFSAIIGAPASYPPTGPAGGALSGSYPNPTINALTAILAAGNITPGAKGQMLRTDPTGVFSEFANVGVIQRYTKQIAGLNSSTAASTSGNPSSTDGSLIASVSFTPISSNSIIKVTLQGWMTLTSAGGAGPASFAIFNSTNLMNFIEPGFYVGPATAQLASHLSGEVASWGAGVARTVQARFGIIGASVTATLGKANANSQFVVEEYFGTLA